MKTITWLLAHWYIPLAIVAAIVGALLWRKRPGVPLPVIVAEKVRQELRIIDATTEVKKIKAELGAEQARQHVEDKYREAKSKLDFRQAEQAEMLADDPVALAKFLIRAGAGG